LGAPEQELVGDDVAVAVIDGLACDVGGPGAGCRSPFDRRAEGRARRPRESLTVRTVHRSPPPGMGTLVVMNSTKRIAGGPSTARTTQHVRRRPPAPM